MNVKEANREYNLDIGEDSYSTIFYFSEKTESMPFFSYCSGHFFCNRNYYTVNRVLEGYLIIYTIRGCGILDINNKTYTLDTNSVVLIDCDIPHSYRTKEDTWELYYLRFAGRAAETYYTMISAPEFRVLHFKSTDNIRTCIEHNINISFIAGIRSSFIQNKIITDLLTDILLNCNASEKRIDESTKETLKAVDNYITINYQNAISLDDIAEHVHLNVNYLSRLYKTNTGTTIHETLLTFRIDKAKDLLINTDMKIADIAEQVGFQSANTFIRCFKKQVQMNPLAYRQCM